MKGISVSLTHEESLICRLIAFAKAKESRLTETKESKLSSADGIELDYLGFSGEFAFCKIFNLMPDFTTHVKSSKDGTDLGDCVLNGMKIDVKTTSNSFGCLRVLKWKKPNSVDVYALMTRESDFVYTFRGFVSSKEVFKQDRLNSSTYPNCYVVEQYELLELEEVKGEPKEALTQGCKGKTSACVQSELRLEATTCGRCIEKQSKSEQTDSYHLGKLS